jgi:hypothetical protein
MSSSANDDDNDHDASLSIQDPDVSLDTDTFKATNPASDKKVECIFCNGTLQSIGKEQGGSSTCLVSRGGGIQCVLGR